MNKIEASWDKSNYEPNPDFLNINIDGVWLDEFLEKFKHEVKGCIPTLLHMDDKREEKVVWDRFLPDEGKTSYCPILMCSDDVDFYCICIVAEIQNLGDRVVWIRIGSDGSDVRIAENVGTEVNWFENYEKLEFTKEDYLKVIDTFKKQYELDEKE